jgi:hypothetical protein
MPNAGMQVSPVAQPILNLRSSLFWDFMQRILVVSYRFGTTYRSRNVRNYQHTFVTSQKSEDLISTAEEAWNHAIWNSELDRDEWRPHVLVAVSPLNGPGHRLDRKWVDPWVGENAEEKMKNCVFAENPTPVASSSTT